MRYCTLYLTLTMVNDSINYMKSDRSAENLKMIIALLCTTLVIHFFYNGIIAATR